VPGHVEGDFEAEENGGIESGGDDSDVDAED
jgi:hypothetical protein